MESSWLKKYIFRRYSNMKNTVLQNLKKFFWYCIAISTLEDVRNSILNDESFLRDVKNSREATIHLSKNILGLLHQK